MLAKGGGAMAEKKPPVAGADALKPSIPPLKADPKRPFSGAAGAAAGLEIRCPADDWAARPRRGRSTGETSSGSDVSSSRRRARGRRTEDGGDVSGGSGAARGRAKGSAVGDVEPSMAARRVRAEHAPESGLVKSRRAAQDGDASVGPKFGRRHAKSLKCPWIFWLAREHRTRISDKDLVGYALLIMY